MCIYRHHAHTHAHAHTHTHNHIRACARAHTHKHAHRHTHAHTQRDENGYTTRDKQSASQYSRGTPERSYSLARTAEAALKDGALGCGPAEAPHCAHRRSVAVCLAPHSPQKLGIPRCTNQHKLKNACTRERKKQRQGRKMNVQVG